MSCDDVPYYEAVKDYQEFWCDHPGREQSVVAVQVHPTEGTAQYDIRCGECGIIRRRQGRAPSKERLAA